MTYCTTPLMGVNTSDATASASDFAVGAKVAMNDGGEAIYVKASATIVAGDVLQIDSTGIATPITTALCAANTTTAELLVGVAHVSITSGQFGWACLRGKPVAGINVAASCVRGAPLYTTVTGGRLDDDATTSHLLAGIMIDTTVVGAGVTPGYCSNPVLVRGTVGA